MEIKKAKVGFIKMLGCGETPKINYGPYSSWDEIKALSQLSEKAFRIFAELVKDKAKKLLEPINHLF